MPRRKELKLKLSRKNTSHTWKRLKESFLNHLLTLSSRAVTTYFWKDRNKCLLCSRDNFPRVEYSLFNRFGEYSYPELTSHYIEQHQYAPPKKFWKWVIKSSKLPLTPFEKFTLEKLK